MSSSVRIERDEAATPLPMAAPRPPIQVTQELRLVSAELGASLFGEEVRLRREVLLWQQWLRYFALGVMVVLALLFGSEARGSLGPLDALAGAYVAVVMVTSEVLRRAPAARAVAWFPSLLLAADVTLVAGFVYLTSAPQQFDRILLLGFLSMQLGVFYFGRRHGSFAAGLTVVAYLVVAIAPPFVAGPRPAPLSLAFDVILFVMVSGVLIYTFGSFHERLDALRMYCKVVERGESASLPHLGGERWPDALTLLARSFRSMHVQLAEQIGSDPLTGCMNRRALESKLRADLRQARRRGSTVAAVAVDLDHFKEINDSRGHLVGDVVLQQLAEIFKSTARDTDAVARVGGDEFVIILADTDWQGALLFAERTRRRVDEATFGPAGMSIGATISLGVALSRGNDPVSTDMLLKEADVALYKAKTAGRNRVFS